MEYSVLMSVYAKEEPVYLDTAIQSMLDQTVRTDDFVIVCDGPLTAELDAGFGTASCAKSCRTSSCPPSAEYWHRGSIEYRPYSLQK